jgi:hypothetical protein
MMVDAQTDARAGFHGRDAQQRIGYPDWVRFPAALQCRRSVPATVNNLSTMESET